MDELKALFLSEDSPSFIWDQIKAILDEQREPSRAHDTEIVHKGVNFLRRMRSGAQSRAAIRRDYPDLYGAFGLWLNDASVKWQIEAGLLTDADDHQIASWTGQRPEVIDLYGKVFYNVRPMRGAKGYILNSVLHPSVRKGLADRDYDYLYKTVAYMAGWEGFQAFLDIGEMNSGARDFFQKSYRSQLLKKGWIAVNRLEVNQYNALEVMDRLREQERMEKEGDIPKEQAQDNAMDLMRALLGNCKMAIIPSTKALTQDEPRVTEILGAAKILKYNDPIPGAVPVEGATNGKAE